MKKLILPILLLGSLVVSGQVGSNSGSGVSIGGGSGGGSSSITGGTCTNQAVTALNTSGVPTCTTITSAYVNNTIALTGTDINTSNQVTATHLSAALPINQGGTNTTSTLTGLVRGGSSFTAAELSGDVTTSGSNVVTVTKVNGVAYASGWPSVYTAKTGTYTAVAFDDVDCTANTFTVTLPASSSNTNKPIWITNSGSGVITVGRTGSDVIGNQAETSQTLNPGDSMTFFSSGTGLWRIH